MTTSSLHLGACTWAYVWQLEMRETVERLAEFGYSTLDVITVPPHLWPSTWNAVERRSLKRVLDAEQTQIESLNVPFTDVNMCSVNPDTREWSVEQIVSVAQLAADLGVPRVTFVPGKRLNFNAPSAKDTAGWLDASMEVLLDRTETLGVQFLLELHPMSVFPTTTSLVEYLDRAHPTRTAIALDVANADYVGESPAESIVHARHWLGQVHLSDQPNGHWAHDRIGSGDIDFASIAQALDSIEFSGTSILEVIDPEPDSAFTQARDLLRKVGWSPQARDTHARTERTP